MGKFIIRRMGLENFWYYSEFIFEFSDGHLLLRGRNGSGKSVTMLSFLPVLMDGITSANRLDSFGSRDRNMADLLLGEQKISHVTERTGYLWIEYQQDNRFVTTGMGLHFKRGGQLRKWYFVIEDGRRIGFDLELARNDGEDNAIALPRDTLKQLMQKGGRFFDQQSAYSDYVRQRIYGFKSMEDFNDAIALLINIRSPKLNSDFNPSRLEKILTTALPNLSMGNVEVSAKILDQIDLTNEQIELGKAHLKAIKPLVKAYHNYLVAHFTMIVHELLKVQAKENQQVKALEQSKVQLRTDQDQLAAFTQRLNEIEQLLKQHVVERDKLQHHEGFELAAEVTKLTEGLKILNNDHHQLNSKRDSTKNEYQIKQLELDKILEQLIVVEKNLAESQEAMSTLAEQSGFLATHRNWFDADHSDLNVIEAQIETYRSHLQAVLKLLRQFDQTKVEHKHLDEQLGQLTQKVNDLITEQTTLSSTYQSEQERLKDILAQKQSEWFVPVANSVMAEVGHQIDHLYNDEIPTWEDALRPLWHVFDEKRTELHQMIQINAGRIGDIKLRIEDLSQQQAEIRKAPYPVPDRVPRIVESRRKVSEGHPFYQMVDFKSDIPQQQRNAIEGALLASGILDALVVKSHTLIFGDQQLDANPVLFKMTLADYLVPENKDAFKPYQIALDDALRTILVDAEEDADSEFKASISLDGYYRVGVLIGRAPEAYEAQYIGATAQAKTRENQIAVLQREIDQLTQKIADQQLMQAQLQQQLDQIDEEWHSLPNDDELKIMHIKIVDNRQQIETQSRFQSQLDLELRRKQAEIDQLSVDLRKITEFDSLQLLSDQYDTAIQTFADYRLSLNKWWGVSKEYQDKQRLIEASRSVLNEIQSRIDDVDEQICKLKASIASQAADLDAYQKLQDAAGDLNEIRDQIASLNQSDHQLTQEQHQKTEATGRLKIQIEHTEESIQTVGEEAGFSKRYLELLRLTQKRALRDFPVEDDMLNQAKALPSPTTEELHDLTEKLQDQFTKSQSVLADFSLSLSTKLSTPAPKWVTDMQDDPTMTNWTTQLSSKIFVEAMIAQQRQPLSVLEESLITQDENNRMALSAQEEQLYKNIIMENLGQLIRQKIIDAEALVQKMNKVLAQQENDSHLKIHLDWHIKPNDEMSDSTTETIATLFKKDARFLTDTDYQSLKHFLEMKIKAEEKAQAEETGQVQTSIVLRNALDYRQWFEFKLQYSQRETQKRSLTNKTFNRFYGGEKAITMYTPLFVAMYAWYKNASPDAPYVITLDEAFAGIDENNIAQLFKTIENLNFNYVMNSQQLQGEYDTVSSLNTYELIRSEQDDHVTAIKIHWDGK